MSFLHSFPKSCCVVSWDALRRGCERAKKKILPIFFCLPLFSVEIKKTAWLVRAVVLKEIYFILFSCWLSWMFDNDGKNFICKWKSLSFFFKNFSLISKGVCVWESFLGLLRIFLQFIERFLIWWTLKLCPFAPFFRFYKISKISPKFHWKIPQKFLYLLDAANKSNKNNFLFCSLPIERTFQQISLPIFLTIHKDSL